jgi:hypothetical protein
LNRFLGVLAIGIHPAEPVFMRVAAVLQARLQTQELICYAAAIALGILARRAMWLGGALACRPAVSRLN